MYYPERMKARPSSSKCLRKSFEAHSSYRDEVPMIIICYLLILDIYHPDRITMNQNVLQGRTPFKIEQRPFTVKTHLTKFLTFTHTCTLYIKVNICVLIAFRK